MFGGIKTLLNNFLPVSVKNISKRFIGTMCHIFIMNNQPLSSRTTSLHGRKPSWRWQWEWC